MTHYNIVQYYISHNTVSRRA